MRFLVVDNEDEYALPLITNLGALFKGSDVLPERKVDGTANLERWEDVLNLVRSMGDDSTTVVFLDLSLIHI